MVRIVGAAENGDLSLPFADDVVLLALLDCDLKCPLDEVVGFSKNATLT